MKKIFSALIFVGAAVSLQAQSMYDALTFSDINYYGTARSIAVGNAMTALGSDLGSVVLNPAGSAVNPYSQYSISLANSNSRQLSTYFEYVGADAQSKDALNRRFRTTMPEIGFVTTLNTYRKSGVKRVSFGFLSSTTNLFLDRFSVNGQNTNSTFTGAFAADAAGFTTGVLNSYDNFYPSGNSAPSWNSLLAFQTGMINTHEKLPEKEYLGIVEDAYLDEEGHPGVTRIGTINQNFTRQTAGSKYDLVFNFGMDINDNLFLGFNLGCPVIDYSYLETIRETAPDPTQFEIRYQDGYSTYFFRSKYGYHYNVSAEGIYGKLGVIWLPVPGLRVGASIQTPTAMNIEESYGVEGATLYTDSSNDSSLRSPEDAGRYDYHLTSPYRASIGVAFTFANLGFISGDWEIADYSTMKFRDYEYDGTFDIANTVNRNFCGAQNMFRVGAELKILPTLAARMGYTYKDTPERYYTNERGEMVDAGYFASNFSQFDRGAEVLCHKYRIKENTQSVSVGLGYSSSKSFFADFALRSTWYPKAEYALYADYLSDLTSPRAATTKRITDLVFTLGWRF